MCFLIIILKRQSKLSVNNSKQEDSIIILAWPETPARAIGRWYDYITKLLGFLKNGYYKAGHAAAVLVNHKIKELKYFDFGRYHMPQKFGRVRDEQSDPELKIHLKADISDDNKTLNIKEILISINANKECNGEGILYASILENISFEKAFRFAKNLQNSDAVDYGPYNLKGSNCSRFIASLAKAGNPERKIKFRLSFPLLFTPMPKGNVIACNSVFYLVNDKDVEQQKVTLLEMLRNFIIPYIPKKNKSGNKEKHKEIINQNQFQNSEVYV